MKYILRTIFNGFSQIIFPNVCVCCGNENTQKDKQLCSFCLQDRFEDANPNNSRVSSDTLLPEGIIVQHALWKFDKGGDLQHLLHQLKYEQMVTIGVDLGRKLGERVKHHPLLRQELQARDAVLLPVPLHHKKYRKRGFNQAFKLAQGFQSVWNSIAICDADDVVRTKNTQSQTGFSLEKRIQNMEDAFKVRNEAVIRGKLIVIIDDVFTTGSTTFELAKTLQKAGSGPAIVLTIAQA
jgi:ComF family protein